MDGRQRINNFLVMGHMPHRYPTNSTTLMVIGEGSPRQLIGLWTRLAAFIMSGEMAIGYFMSHATRGFSLSQMAAMLPFSTA
jgi:hypothetical protein